MASLPFISPPDTEAFLQMYNSARPINGRVSAEAASQLMKRSNLPVDVLGHIWSLSNLSNSNSLSQPEFMLAMHLTKIKVNGAVLPSQLPDPVRLAVVTAMNLQVQPTQHSRVPSRNQIANWAIDPAEKSQYDSIFRVWDPRNTGTSFYNSSGFIDGDRARNIFSQSGLSDNILAHIWHVYLDLRSLSDTHNHGKLNGDEFAVAMHLLYKKLAGVDLPQKLPEELVPPSTRDLTSMASLMKNQVISDLINKPKKSLQSSIDKSNEPLLSDFAGSTVGASAATLEADRAVEVCYCIIIKEAQLADLQNRIEDKRKQLSIIKPQTEASLRAIKDIEAAILETKKEALSLNSRIIISMTQMASPNSSSRGTDTVGLSNQVIELARECKKLEQDLASQKTLVINAKERKESGTSSPASLNVSSLLGATGGSDVVANKTAALLAKRMAALGVGGSSGTATPSRSSEINAIENDLTQRLRNIDDIVKSATEYSLITTNNSSWEPNPEDKLKFYDGIGFHSNEVVQLCKDMKSAILLVPKPSALDRAPLSSSQNSYMKQSFAMETRPDQKGKTLDFRPVSERSPEFPSGIEIPVNSSDVKSIEPKPSITKISLEPSTPSHIANENNAGERDFYMTRDKESLYLKSFGAHPAPYQMIDPYSESPGRHKMNSSTPFALNPYSISKETKNSVPYKSGSYSNHNQSKEANPYSNSVEKSKITPEVDPIPLADESKPYASSKPFFSMNSNPYFVQSQPSRSINSSHLESSSKADLLSTSSAALNSTSIEPPSLAKNVLKTTSSIKELELPNLIPDSGPTSTNLPLSSFIPTPPPPPPYGASIPISLTDSYESSTFSAPLIKMPLGDRSDLMLSIRTAGVGALKKSSDQKILSARPVQKPSTKVPVKKHAVVNVVNQPTDSIVETSAPSTSFNDMRQNLAHLFGGSRAEKEILPLALPLEVAKGVFVQEQQPTSPAVETSVTGKKSLPVINLTPGAIQDSEESWEVVEEQVMYTVKAVFDFQGGKDDDLPFIIGDKIQVIREHEEWLFGKRVDTKEYGWFPKSFIQPVEKDADTKRDDEVYISAGEVVVVLDKPDVNWWYIEALKGSGFAPSAFLKELSTSEAEASVANKNQGRGGGSAGGFDSTSLFDNIPQQAAGEFDNSSSFDMQRQQSTTGQNDAFDWGLGSTESGDPFDFSVFSLGNKVCQEKPLENKPPPSTSGLKQVAYNKPWSQSVDSSVLLQISPIEKKRQEAIFELIGTEQSYVNDLQLMVEAEYSFDMFASFLKQVQSLENYTPFCGNLSAGLNYLQQKRQQDRSLQAFLKESQKNPKCRSLDLSSFLLLPMQRITRYSLIFKQIYQYTPEGHPDHEDVAQAYELSEATADLINTAARDRENQLKLDEINRQVDFGVSDGLKKEFSLDAPTEYVGRRKFILDSVLEKKKTGKKVHAFLFNDILLLCVKTRNSSIPYGLYRQPMYLQDVDIQDLGETEMGIAYPIIDLLVFRVPGSEKKKWISHVQIQKQILCNAMNRKL